MASCSIKWPANKQNLGSNFGAKRMSLQRFILEISVFLAVSIDHASKVLLKQGRAAHKTVNDIIHSALTSCIARNMQGCSVRGIRLPYLMHRAYSSLTNLTALTNSPKSLDLSPAKPQRPVAELDGWRLLPDRLLHGEPPMMRWQPCSCTSLHPQRDCLSPPRAVP